MRPVAVLLLSTLVGACSPPAATLGNSHTSTHSLASAVLRAIEQRNIDALRALAINEQEFREHVWPELPAARPERNLPFSYVWGDLRQKSDASLGRVLSAHGGKTYALSGVRFLGQTTDYKTYQVHRDTELTVKGPEGAEQRLRLFGSVLEKSGRFKVFSYVVDD